MQIWRKQFSRSADIEDRFIILNNFWLSASKRVVLSMTMSVTINIDNFQTWSEIFKEIERQKNLRTFTVIERDIHHRERKPRCSAAMEVRRIKFCKRGRRVGITQCKIDQTSCHIQQSGRLVSTPGPSDRDKRGQNKEQLPIQCREVQTCF